MEHKISFTGSVYIPASLLQIELEIGKRMKLAPMHNQHSVCKRELKSVNWLSTLKPKSFVEEVEQIPAHKIK